MASYICTACQYIYDEKVQGVAWADLGDDWECPICGLGVELFRLLDENSGNRGNR
jgi:rubredoxin